MINKKISNLYLRTNFYTSFDGHKQISKSMSNAQTGFTPVMPPLKVIINILHYIYLLYIALGSMYVCIYVCLKPISFGTDGPI